MTKYRYLLVVDGDGGCFGAGEIAVIHSDYPIEKITRKDEDRKYVVLENGDEIEFLFAHTKEEVARMFQQPHGPKAEKLSSKDKWVRSRQGLSHESLD